MARLFLVSLVFAVVAATPSLELQCSALSSQFTALGVDAACAGASAQLPVIFSGLEATIPQACDLSAAKSRFNTVTTCTGLADAFLGYCRTLGSCGSGSSGSPGGSSSPSTSPSPSPPPAAPKKLVVSLKILETSLNATTIVKVKQYFVTLLNALLAGANIVVTLDDVTLDIPSQARRRLLSEMAITVAVSLPPDAKTGELVDALSTPAALEAAKTSFESFGLTVTSLDVPEQVDTKVAQGVNGGKKNLNGGEIAAIVIGTLVGVALVLFGLLRLMKGSTGASGKKTTAPQQKSAAASYPAAVTVASSAA